MIKYKTVYYFQNGVDWIDYYVGNADFDVALFTTHSNGKITLACGILVDNVFALNPSEKNYWIKTPAYKNLEYLPRFYKVASISDIINGVEDFINKVKTSKPISNKEILNLLTQLYYRNYETLDKLTKPD